MFRTGGIYHPSIEGSKSKGGSSSPAPARAPTEAPNSLRSKATARVVEAIGEGEIVGLLDGLKSIYFDDTPVQAADDSFNFNGITHVTRNGTPDQAFLPGFPNVETIVAVDTEVVQATPLTRTITNANVNAVRVNMLFPSLIFQNEAGDLVGSTVSFKISIKPNGGAFTDVITEVLTGKTNSAYEKNYRVELTGGSHPFDIKVTRITADSATSALRNETHWASYTEIIDEKITYADTAVIGYTFDSELFGTSIPRRAYHVKGLKIQIPSNYDPVARTYTGTWDGTFDTDYSNNPAWCFYDLITNTRYGLGSRISSDFISQLKWSLYTIGQYCDELVDDGFGGLEPRFVLNVAISTRQEAATVLQSIVSNFRGMFYWAAGSIFVTQDSPTEVTRIVTPANVIDGLINYQSSSLRDRHSAALVTWNNPDELGRPAIEVVEDVELIDRIGYRPLSIVAFGTTSRGQANRVGLWALETEKNQNEICSYRAGFDHADAVPGEVIALSDPSYAGVRLGGRVVSAVFTEPEATNYFRYSQEFNAGNWNKVGLSATVNVADPVGGSDADQLVEDGSTGEHRIRQIPNTYTAAIGQRFIFSIYVKAGTRSRMRLEMNTAFAANTYADFNISAGTILDDTGVETATITDEGSGWYRCSIAALANAAVSGVQHFLFCLDGSSNKSYTGVNTDVAMTVWGGQVEQQDTQDTPTSQIFTGPDPVTRYRGPCTQITIDSPVTLAAATEYNLYVIEERGTIVTGILSNGAGSTSVFDIASPYLSLTPNAGAMWVLSSEEAIEFRQFRILSNVEVEKNVFEINCIKHDPNKYARIEESKTFDAPTFSTLADPFKVMSPSNLTATELLYTTRDGSGVKAKVILDWGPSPSPWITHYEAQFKVSDDEDWHPAGTTGTNSVDIYDIDPGIYSFRVRAYNSLGSNSSFITITNQQVSGLLAPPSAIANFSITALGDIAYATWDSSPDLDVRIGGRLRIRWAPATSGATWDTAVEIVPGVDGKNTSAALPLLVGTYLIRAYDSSGIPSAVSSYVNSKAPIFWNLSFISTISEHSTFTGTKTDCSVASGRLEINVDGGGDVLPEANYVFANKLDATTVKNIRLTANIVVAVTNVNTNIDDITDLMDTWLDFDGAAGGDCRVELWVRTTDDDPAGSPTWGPYSRFVAGNYNARAFDFKLFMFSNNANFNIYVTTLSVTANEAS